MKVVDDLKRKWNSLSEESKINIVGITCGGLCTACGFFLGWFVGHVAGVADMAGYISDILQNAEVFPSDVEVTKF